MTRANRVPNVFMPEQVPDKLDSLLISKAWVCDLDHSSHSYYVLEDDRNIQVAGFGSLD
jgi:hypothetical protein